MDSRKNTDGPLAIVNTSNADTPLTDESVTPLLTLDVWEQEYYIDYRNGRHQHSGNSWRIANCVFAASNFARNVLRLGLMSKDAKSIN